MNDKLKAAIEWAQDLRRYPFSVRHFVPVLAAAARSAETARVFQCASELMFEPAECDWPLCACDRHAMAVVEKLEELGWKTDEEVHEATRRRIFRLVEEAMRKRARKEEK